MQKEDILAAQEEAEKFIESIQEWLEYQAHNEYSSGMLTATVKRRSMDLTRSLSKMRQNK